MDKEKSEYEGNASNSMSQEQLSLNAKRPASPLDPDSPNSLQQSPKRSAKANVNSNHFTPSRRPLRLSGSLPNLDLPNSLEKTLIANQTVSLELNGLHQVQVFENNMPKTNDTAKSAFNISTHNSFEILNGNEKVLVNNSNPKPLAVHKNKTPPITVVGALNLSSAMQILNNQTTNVKYTIKHCSIGTKILLNGIEDYNKLKALLKTANVEFFSHDLRTDKYDKFVLSGIAKMDADDIAESLKTYQLEAVEIREITLKNKRFDDEGVYIVSFTHGTAKLPNLNKTRINYTIPKWRLYQESKNKVTQCRRCQLYGHGMQNCNLKPKCPTCGLGHYLIDCNSPVQKCANCKGDHLATDSNCPKRHEFLEMRKRMASSNKKSSTNKPTTAQRAAIGNFEKPMRFYTAKSQSTSAAADKPFAPKWSSLFKNNPAPIVQPSTSNDKFKPEEIGPIMVELLSGLRHCQNKEQQLIVMFEIATKYVYNVQP